MMNADVLHRVLTFMPGLRLLRLLQIIQSKELRKLILRSIHSMDAVDDYSIVTPDAKLFPTDKEELKTFAKAIRYVSNPQSLSPDKNLCYSNVTHILVWKYNEIKFKSRFPRVHYLICAYVPSYIPSTVTTLQCDVSITTIMNYMWSAVFPSVITLLCNNSVDLTKVMQVFPNLQNLEALWISKQPEAPNLAPSKLIKNLVVSEFLNNETVAASNAVMLLPGRGWAKANYKVIERGKYVWDESHRHIFDIPDECTHLACLDIPLCGIKNVTHLILLRREPLEAPLVLRSDCLEKIDIHVDALDLGSQLERLKKRGYIPKTTFIRKNYRATRQPFSRGRGFSWQFPDIVGNWT